MGFLYRLLAFGFLSDAMAVCVSGQDQGQSTISGYVTCRTEAVLQGEDGQHQSGTGEQRAIHAFTLEVRVGNAAAIHIYEKLGFVTAGVRKGFYEKPKEDALIMWRRQLSAQ